MNKFASKTDNGAAFLWYNLKCMSAIGEINAKFQSMKWVVLDINGLFKNDYGIEVLEVIKPRKGRFWYYKILSALLFRKFDLFVFVVDANEFLLFGNIFGCIIFPQRIAVYDIADGNWKISGYWENLIIAIVEAVLSILLIPFSYIMVIFLALFFRREVMAGWQKGSKGTNNDTKI